MDSDRSEPSDLNELLGELHTEMVQNLLTRIKNNEASDKDMEVARKLLAQNGIVVSPKASGNLLRLADALPFKPGETG